ncbi:hypothetical protein SEUCBS139899_002356 [Sporothrix eucalyptigena]|uniref:NACHT-NTPase and P-loop NTPases N-terminal domain-containing protein n=1 Tax=Sporothrix eucalyptigena TaxID=1812306 RepID=A0ABP0B1X4_9PEZI
MTGVVEAGTVLGLISAIIAICEAAEEIYEAAGDLKGLPKKFRTAAEQIPLVYYTLGLAETDIKANKVGKEALQSVIPVLEQCKGSAASLKEIFDKTLPGKDDSTAKRVFSGVKILYKSNKVKSYMEDVFQNLQLLAEHQVFQDAKTLGQITEAIEQLENASDEQEQSQFVNSGAGSINANTSSGTQNNNNNTGSGQMYNAQTQHFVKPNYSNQKHPTGGVWMVPFERNDSFTSRDDELKTVRLLLFKQDRTAKVAITGLGGIGKTHLVLELLYRIREEEEYKHCSVLWIPAMSEESLSQAYLEAAKELGIPGWDDKSADVKQLVQHHLGDKATGKWILVFDNADEISMWLDAPHPNSRRLLDYLPKNSQGSIIFTTRNAKLADELANHHVVEVLDMGETGGKKVLRNYLRNQDLLKNEEDTIFRKRYFRQANLETKRPMLLAH